MGMFFFVYFCKQYIGFIEYLVIYMIIYVFFSCAVLSYLRNPPNAKTKKV